MLILGTLPNHAERHAKYAKIEFESFHNIKSGEENTKIEIESLKTQRDCTRCMAASFARYNEGNRYIVRWRNFLFLFTEH
jgi:hypothetical protein